MGTRRLGGIPPIVTVLITISAVVAAGLVAWFLFSTTASATKQVLLEVTGAYALCSDSSCDVHITLRNVGTVNATISNVKIEIANVDGEHPCTPLGAVPPGGSTNIKCEIAGNVPDGAAAVLVVTATPSGGSRQSLSIAFKIVRP